MTNTGDITIDGVWKTFRIFHNRSTTLKQALLRRNKDEFEEFWALRDVSFEIPRGSTFGLIGANGAGKSTMLKVLARILVPDRGSVQINGRVSALLELGAGFHPELTGRENVFLNGSILGMSAASLRAKFDDIVAFAGLEQFIDQPIKTYSSGMFARLGFSVAVAVEPEVLIVDEVLAVGDEQFQRRCAERMSELRSDGRTVVLVSHSLGQMQQICDQAAWLDKGVIREIGATDEVIEAYLGSVRTAYRLDRRGRQRYGTGEIKLEAEIVSRENPLRTGSPAVFRFHWSSEQRLDDLGLTFNVRAVDGYVVTGALTHYDPRWLTLGPGQGTLEYDVPSLLLTPGSYHVESSISDRHTGQVYDHCPRIVEFDVAAAHEHEAAQGAVSLAGHWRDGGGQ